jgi:16S rRNA processing protein RimM
LTGAPGSQRGPGGDAGLPVGRVGRSHGLDGSFYVTRPLARVLTLGTRLRITPGAGAAGPSAEIVRRAGTEKRPIVRLEGVEDRASAEALRGAELSVEASEAPALGDGEWWAHELEGCVVTDGARQLGTVLRMLALPSCEALEVRSADGGEPVLVPLVKDAVRAVDVAARRIDVDLEFLNLAAPRPPSERRAGERERREGDGGP